MRSALILTLSLSCAGFCHAQASAPAQAAAKLPQTSDSAASGAVEKRTERIHIEDTGAKIDELRIGGETKSIDVKPQGSMPAYQVAPTSGERTWKVLGF
jgi:hypothetical protein